MNIYEKMQKAKVELQKKDLKKSGENKFSKYKYYELGDFMPAINEICLDLKLFTQVNFENDNAVLTILNIEKIDEKLLYMSKMIETQLKGCNELQTLGGVQTYQRRYLYMNAFEISENDYYIDGNNKNDDKKDNKDLEENDNAFKDDNTDIENEDLDDLVTEQQAKTVCAIMIQKGLNVEKQLQDNYEISSTKYLTKRQYASILNAIKNLPNKK